MVRLDKVSVIIPVYDTEEYIEECIKSVLEQTYQNIEMIVVNDGSNNDCKNMLESLSNKYNNMKLFHFNERRGVGAARNFGVEQANGEFVYFLDSDDYLEPNVLKKLNQNIKNHDIIKGRTYSTNFSKSFAILFNGLTQVKTYEDNRFKLLKNNSAANYLIRKRFITENNLRFSEDVDIYADLQFIIPAFKYHEQIPYVKDAIYFKRKRNDPISNPALSQYDDLKKINDFLFMYNYLKDIIHDEEADLFLDQHLLNFYRKDVVKYFKQNKKKSELLRDLKKSLQRISPEVIKAYDLFLKLEIGPLLKGNIKKYKRVIDRHNFLREFRKGMKTKRKFYIFLYRHVFLKLPIKKDLVFFESFLGKNYSDSPKYIYEYMLENNMNYKYVWCFDEERKLPGTAKTVKRFSLRYFYSLARAKYWVSNSRLPRYLDKREENVYLQTWHGTPLKQLVFDMDEVYSANPNYKRHFYEQSRRWDYLSSPNKYSSDIFRRAFKFNKKFIEAGYPRNDILYNKNTEQDINAIKKEIGVPLDKKVVLYAPTWRDDEFYSRGKYKFTLQLNLEKMKEELGDEYIVLLRMHYFIASQMDISEFEGFAYDFSAYDDIAELYLVSDILITDYSSVFFDYANLKRPILYYTYDLEKYRDTLRGFYIDIETEVPGPLLRSTDEVIDAIQNINDIQDRYKERYDDFYNRFCHWDDGNATKKTIEQVFGNEKA